MMNYEEKVIEDCLKEIKKEMRNIDFTKNREFRIAKSKIGCLRIPLFKLFHIAFKEGVYVGKSK